MKVQKAISADTKQIRWLVIDRSYLPVKPIQQYLSFLETCNKSPLTLRAYAHHLKIYWQYLEETNLSWDKISIDTIGNFITYLKEGSSDNVIALKPKTSARSASTINQIIIAVSSFYDYQHRLGNVEELPLYFSKKPHSGSNR